eukprot:TRINITY_DN69769_c0_g1_i1.p1 TRINITY_DN69769_c0_g1~~TRINITY_DN69769_c0_g1_i1.p1  ORF type:complete len:102 (-),score=5.89 TRINITY_DN69769_c0_g1_i1:44-349(-)
MRYGQICPSLTWFLSDISFLRQCFNFLKFLPFKGMGMGISCHKWAFKFQGYDNDVVVEEMKFPLQMHLVQLLGHIWQIDRNPLVRGFLWSVGTKPSSKRIS